MNGQQAYELQETINGVTFVYREPGQDPTIPGIEVKEGHFEDLFLWATSDPADKFVIMDAEPGGESDVIKIFTRAADLSWWKYKVNTGRQRWKRRNGPTWSNSQPVSDLRMRVNDEKDAHPLTMLQAGGINGDYTVVTHPGTTCTMVWNPATRRYTRVCQ